MTEWPPIGKIAAHSAYDMFSWYKYLIVNLVFSHLGFWSGNLFPIAPFTDLCLLVLFFNKLSKGNSLSWALTTTNGSRSLVHFCDGGSRTSHRPASCLRGWLKLHQRWYQNLIAPKACETCLRSTKSLRNVYAKRVSTAEAEGEVMAM